MNSTKIGQCFKLYKSVYVVSGIEGSEYTVDELFVSCKFRNKDDCIISSYSPLTYRDIEAIFENPIECPTTVKGLKDWINL